jgi:hypothetical protein
MNVSTLTKQIGVLLVTIAATAHPALAGPSQSFGSQLTGRANVPAAQCPCNAGLPGGPRVKPSRLASLTSTSSSRCPCNVGLAGGPRVVPSRLASLTSTSSSGCPCNVGLPDGPRGAPAALAPSISLGASTNAASDWFERYVGAHPYGVGTTVTSGSSGQILGSVGDRSHTSTTAVKPEITTGDNSIAPPDWFERYIAVHPYGSLPELRTAGGFDWSDAGVGAGFATGLLTLLMASLIMIRRHTRQRVQIL